MGIRCLAALAWCAASLAAQTPCANTPAYSPCDMAFELNDQEAAAHPNPYAGVELHIEFRSPRFRTFRMPAFWDGGRRLVIRFAPTEGGNWTYRVTSNIQRWEGQTGNFTAVDSGAPGFIKTANVHHWAYTGENAIGGNIPHLWMGDTNYGFALLDDNAFRQMIDARAEQKFNHLRGLALGDGAFPNPDRPDPAWFQRLDERVRYMNNKGMVADLILSVDKFPDWRQRERYLRYIAARYAPMNVTWQLVQAFEDRDNARQLLKESGTKLKELDPYQHPRSAGAHATSAPLLDDGWEDFVSGESADDNVGSVEHQLYAVPFVNQAIPEENFRQRLWNASMNGQYVAAANGATGGPQMKVWFDFFAATRHWELEPYFDVDGGRALALEGVEYIVYVEKPSGPIELLVERHGYDVRWLNPISGEGVTLKDFKGERLTIEPPDRSHDWVLHVSREGHKEGMLRSYKFESRRLGMQEIEQNVPKVPFEIEQPSQDPLSVSKPAPYASKIKRETRATRSMMWLWTGEVAAEGQGYRVVGTGAKGTLKIPAGIARNYPAVLSLRLYGMNANGKVYQLDKPYQLTK